MKLVATDLPAVVLDHYNMLGQTIWKAIKKGSSTITIQVKGIRDKQDTWHKNGSTWVKQEVNDAPAVVDNKLPTPGTLGAELHRQNPNYRGRKRFG